MRLIYEKPQSETCTFAVSGCLLAASNEDLPVVPVTPFRSRKRWMDEDDWDD